MEYSIILNIRVPIILGVTVNIIIIIIMNSIQLVPTVFHSLLV